MYNNIDYNFDYSTHYILFYLFIYYPNSSNGVQMITIVVLYSFQYIKYINTNYKAVIYTYIL